VGGLEGPVGDRTESILDWLVNGAHHLAMDGRSYRPNNRPRRADPDTDR